MNILFIADPNSLHDVRWINYFAARKDFICYLTCRDTNYRSRRTDAFGLNPNVILLPPILDPSTVRPMRTIAQMWKIRRMVARFRIDLLHILYAEPGALWAIGKWLFCVPVVLTTRGTDVLKTIPRFFNRTDLLGRIVSLQYRKAFLQADKITATSQAQVEALGRLCGTEDVVVVRTGVDFQEIGRQAEPSVPFEGERPYVLMPRSMKPIYNHEFTLESIGLLSSISRHNYKFIFINSAGKDDEYFKYVSAQAKRLDAEVIFLAPLTHSKLIELCHGASLVVMNPVSDGSPVSAMEAMACKTPVILPPLAYDQEVFGSAFFFDAWSPQSLKEEIERVLHMDEGERRLRVERSYEAVLENGNYHTEMNKIDRIYKKLVPRGT